MSTKPHLHSRILAPATSCVALSLCIANSVWAVDTPAAVKWGEADVFPQVRLTYFSDNNADFQEEDGESSTGVILAPAAVLRARTGTLNLEAKYEGKYSQEDADFRNYADHLLSLRGVAEFSSRLRGVSELKLTRGHRDPRIFLSQRSTNQTNELVKFNRATVLTRATYGARQAKGNVRLGLQVQSTDFDSTADDQDNSDRVSIAPDIKFSYRISGDTRAFVGVQFTKLTYEDDADDRNRVSTSAGVDWEVTEKTFGSASIGYSRWDFPNNARRSDNALIARVSASYSPFESTDLEIEASRSLNDLDRTGADQVISNKINVGWRYDWNDRFFHRVEVGLEDIDRGDCPEQGQELTKSNFELNYKFRRWLYFGANIAFIQNNVDQCDGITISDPINDYDAQTVGVFIEASL